MRLSLYVDTDRGVLVGGMFDTQQKQLRAVAQYSTLALTVYLVDPTGAAPAPYDKETVTGKTLITSIGVPDGSTAAYAQSSLTAGTDSFTGLLPLNTQAINDALGTKPQITPTLELALINEDGTTDIPLQVPIVIKAAIYDPAQPVVALPFGMTNFAVKSPNGKIFQYTPDETGALVAVEITPEVIA